MAKTEPAQALLKRLQKIEQVHGKLAEMAARIRATAETVADLVKLAQTFIEESAAPSAPRTTRRAKAASKRAPAKRAPRKAGPGRPKAATTTASARSATSARARNPAPRGRPVGSRSKASTPRRPRSPRPPSAT